MVETHSSFLWFDGALVPWRDAHLHVLTHSLHMGGAVFEGMRAYDGRIFLADAHFARLERSAELLGYRLPWSAAELAGAASAVVRANEFADCYLRPIAWRGTESVSVASPKARIHVAIAAWDWPSPAVLGTAADGVRLCVAVWRRPRPDSAPTASKCSGLYMIGTLARHAAANAGFDDALMLDADGNVAETTATNLVAVYGDVLVSPPATCFLDSLTKRHLFDLAGVMGYRLEEHGLSLDRLREADEVMLVGTSIEVLPVVELADGGWTTRWRVGPATLALMAAFEASVRERAVEPAA